jgi:hypothetical protein
MLYRDMKSLPSFHHLSDVDLTTALMRFAQDERTATVQLIAAHAEFDRRQLYLDEGFHSLYGYCVEALKLSEHAALMRIEAARASRQYPAVLEMLGDGRLTLTNLCLVSRHLTAENYATMLSQVSDKRKEDVQRMLAGRDPRPDAPAVIRPLSEDRYRLQVTIDQEARDALRQAQDLLRHALPNGDPSVIVSRALKLLAADLLKKKTSVGAAPRQPSRMAARGRDLPASVMRAVWKRDGGRCAHRGPNGRCNSTSFVEFHHVIPFAKGGAATVENIELRCSAHNKYQARLDGLGRPKEKARSNPSPPRSSG